ncbi:MAG: gliding motility-associated C-terminal domain-containing protein [Ferruginibacter sp.]|nr:gliding motility-associated C-terminal domain-containing protein [Ferruginibacter sp.]
MKSFLITFFFIGLVLPSLANHTKGGWLYYRYVGPGATANSARYVVTLKIYTECILNSNQWCPDVNVSIFNAGDNSLFETVNVVNTDVIDVQNCTRQECHECISDIPNICYKIATFEFIKDLPVTSAGYTLSYQRCCRIANIINLQPGSSTIGDTWTVNIPGTNGRDPLAYKNSSARFSQNDTAIICKDNYFTFDFSATDPDGDDLSYSFTDAYYASRGNGSQCNSRSDAPPFSFVGYQGPFSGTAPLGTGVTINPLTGIVSGIAPSIPGTYVLTCTVTEYKPGTNIIKSSVHKSLHISVADCSLTQAILEPEYFSCDGFTKSFSNKATGGNIQTYTWDFGVAGVSTDTSNIANPSFTFPDTGTYVLKLVVNKNLPCSDSAFSLVKVYPVFTPDFSVLGQCKNTPIRFIDRTVTTYGIVDSWQWNFGDGSAIINLSALQNPVHIYATEANYPVSLAVTNNKGCKGTVNKTILITNKPALDLTNDTLICTIDTLQLNAIGIGTILWSPDYNISNLNSPSPLVSPDVPTMYYAQLIDPYGCTGRDSVFVNVKSFVTIKGGNDTVICQADPIILTLSGDALQYSWTENPSIGSLNNPLLKNPLAIPTTTTTYRVTANIGKCTAQDDITISVVPYPKAMAGADTTICFGTSAQLQATGGSKYSWSPPSFLNNRLIANPISVKPPAGIRYTVTVWDTLGCPKPITSSIFVTVSKVNANAGPKDTAIVLDQPLQLNASGGTSYLWGPVQWLNNIGIVNPLAMPLNDIKYTVKVSNTFGCFDHDSIQVKVYTVAAGIYVPTAFTPNSDGRNDFFRPVALGLKSLEVFRIYNRWGQILFSDTNIESEGWNGTYRGNKQEPGTYVWHAEGTDYRNQKLKRRGYVVLIR